MHKKRAFITVGTTKFEKLIETVSKDEILNRLAALGYTEIMFQTGSGTRKEKKHPAIKLSYANYFDNFEEEIMKSDLIISHAGAGTCLEVLKLGKPLIVVINENLMDNHQNELAEQLQNDEYLYYCTCKDLLETLGKNLNLLKRYHSPNRFGFSNYLNKCMGFV